MLIGFAVCLVLGAASMTYHAAFLLSMVFGYGGLFLLELCSLLGRKPCLANTLPEVYKGLHKPPKGRKCAKHGFLFLLG